MSRSALACAATLGAALIVTGCTLIDREVVRGSGELITEQYDLSGFDRVDAGRALEVRIRPGQEHVVSLTVDDNVVRYVTVTRRGTRLDLDVDDRVDLRDATHLVEITMPALRRLALHGAASGDLAGFEGQQRLDLELSGASRLDCTGIEADVLVLELSGASTTSCAEVQTDDLKVRLSGASVATLDGDASDGRVHASGASSADLGDLVVTDADVRLSGASNAEVSVSEHLEANLSGLSRLRYAGDPDLGSVKTSGGSSVEPMG